MYFDANTLPPFTLLPTAIYNVPAWHHSSGLKGFLLFDCRHEKLFCRPTPNSLYNLTLLLTNEFRDELTLQFITSPCNSGFEWVTKTFFGGFSSWSKICEQFVIKHYESNTRNENHSTLQLTMSLVINYSKRILPSQNQTWVQQNNKNWLL